MLANHIPFSCFYHIQSRLHGTLEVIQAVIDVISNTRASPAVPSVVMFPSLPERVRSASHTVTVKSSSQGGGGAGFLQWEHSEKCFHMGHYTQSLLHLLTLESRFVIRDAAKAESMFHACEDKGRVLGGAGRRSQGQRSGPRVVLWDHFHHYTIIHQSFVVYFPILVPNVSKNIPSSSADIC